MHIFLGNTLMSNGKVHRVICPQFFYQSLEPDNKGSYIEEAGHDYEDEHGSDYGYVSRKIRLTFVRQTRQRIH